MRIMQNIVLKRDEKIDFHLFGFTYQSDLLKKTAKKAITDIKAKFARGDRVRIFSHEKKGYSITFDSCLPGCPEVGFVEGFFSSECSNTVAKRDRIGFERKFATGVLKISRLLMRPIIFFLQFSS